jgi:hypothetical protein
LDSKFGTPALFRFWDNAKKKNKIFICTPFVFGSLLLGRHLKKHSINTNI